MSPYDGTLSLWCSLPDAATISGVPRLLHCSQSLTAGRILRVDVCEYQEGRNRAMGTIMGYVLSRLETHLPSDLFALPLTGWKSGRHLLLAPFPEYS